MERLHIIFLGPVNSGKSTLVNAICGQEVSLVSAVPGTTTDPVRKAVELPGLGPCILIDTPGSDDFSILGDERQRLMKKALAEADVAVVLGDTSAPDGIPSVRYGGESVEVLLKRIADSLPKESKKFLTGNLVKAGDTVVLVMPQDSEAPKGRLILPQVQVIRELLDRGCTPLCCTPESLSGALAALSAAPALVITDSQVFGEVDAAIPGDVPLTSFSILLAGAKGDIHTFVEGARAIDNLQPGNRVLIAEACTHVPDTEDIGRVKIPALLRKKVEGIAGGGVYPKPVATLGRTTPKISRFSGAPVPNPSRGPSHAMGGVEANAETVWDTHHQPQKDTLIIDIAAGNDFPEELEGYDLIIQCGGCVASDALIRARMRKALLAGVPITNYGIAIAALSGILPRVALP